MEIRRDPLPKSGFYVYVHCRKDGTPFYVGKGSAGPNNSRAYAFTVSRNRAYINCLNKQGVRNIHVRIYPRDTEEEAFEFEKQLIQIQRAAGFKLHNLAEGGRGGTTGTVSSHESNLKRSLALKGIPLTKEHAEKIAKALRKVKHSEKSKVNFSKGQQSRYATLTKEERINLTAHLRNRVRTPEEIAKRSAGLKAGWLKRKLRATIGADKGVKNDY